MAFWTLRTRASSFVVALRRASTFSLGSESAQRVAILDEDGKATTYEQLSRQSKQLAAFIKKATSGPGARVCVLCDQDALFPAALLAVWRSGRVAVPLCKAHPPKVMEYYMHDAQADVVVASRVFIEKIEPVLGQRRLLVVEEVLEAGPVLDDALDDVMAADDESPALMLYTSGTTGPPKGVVLSHANIRSQVDCLVRAWKWTQEDSILHVLPLHHTHGVVNCLLCPLSVGARVVMRTDFDAESTWRALLSPDVNLFMAVPTIYAKLLQAHPRLFADPSEVERVKRTLRSQIRLMVSGSAALPEPVLTSWREVSGHTLLERYGMTEIGMALSNPLEEALRRPGCVGKPLPTVQARIVRKDDSGFEVLATATSEGHTGTACSGDLEVRGPNVFSGGYWNKPEATANEFSSDEGGNWFKTGDVVEISDEGIFKILGRKSVDIIKSGGYKISALDVERVLLGHPFVADVAVVGLDDQVWGQKVAAVVTLDGEANVNEVDSAVLQAWCKERLAAYQVPKEFRIGKKNLPRNNMGKVNKKELIKTVFQSEKA